MLNQDFVTSQKFTSYRNCTEVLLFYGQKTLFFQVMLSLISMYKGSCNKSQTVNLQMRSQPNDQVMVSLLHHQKRDLKRILNWTASTPSSAKVEPQGTRTAQNRHSKFSISVPNKISTALLMNPSIYEYFLALVMSFTPDTVFENHRTPKRIQDVDQKDSKFFISVPNKITNYLHLQQFESRALLNEAQYICIFSCSRDVIYLINILIRIFLGIIFSI